MAKKPGTVIERDRGMKRAMRAIKSMKGWKVTVGAHAEEDNRSDGEIDNVGLAVVHEFGKNINHPGGTPYMIASGRAVFLKKGDPRAIGVTKPHRIKIPERSFIRSAWDKNVRSKYLPLMKRGSLAIIDGKATPKKALGLVGEVVLSDIINGINAGISPPNKPATIARKGSSTPLIDTGQLKSAIKYKVEKT